jgi:hypothetical protein
VAPARDARALRWTDRRVSLAPCSAPTTALELRTRCGPAHCTADWALWGGPRVHFRRAPQTPRRPLVLLISIDTLRPDRLDLYGGERATAPSLRALAADGITFETAVAPDSWTIPSHASLFTSTEPHLHRADGSHALRADLPTLAEVFSAAGWETAAFVDSPWLDRPDFRRGFDHFDAATPGLPLARRGVRLVQPRMLRWIDRPSQAPAFVFWHVMDVHGPYGARAPFGGRFRAALDPTASRQPPLRTLAELGYHDYLELERFRTLEDLLAAYDEGIAMVDAAVGELLARLAALGLYEDAVVAVTSDHGESLFDRATWVGRARSTRERAWRAWSGCSTWPRRSSTRPASRCPPRSAAGASPCRRRARRQLPSSPWARTPTPARSTCGRARSST